MVLEETSNTPDVFAKDDAPPSDGQESTAASAIRRLSARPNKVVTDASATVTPNELQLQYRVNRGPLRNYQIPFDRMPVQGITRQVAFGNPAATSRTSPFLVDLLTTMESVNGRPVTQTEAEGMALHVARRQLYGIAAFWGGLVVGGAATFATRKNFKFPFRKPRPVERYNLFPLQRAPLLTGQFARAGWHITRTFAYVSVVWVALIPFSEYLGGNAQAVHLLRDDRTSNLIQETGRSMQRIRQEMQEGRKEKTGRNATGASRGQDADQAASSSPGDGEYYGVSPGGFAQDDNSPTSSQDPYSTSPTNTGILSDAQTQSHTRSQSSSPSSSDPSRRNTFDLERVERQPRTFDSDYNNPPSSSSSSSSSSPFFDDASPTAGNDPYTSSSSSSSSSQPTTSAWARVRQSANSNSNSSHQTSSTSSPSPSSSPADPQNKRGILPANMRRPSPSAHQLQQQSASDEYGTSADSASFSREGQERQSAREQAQREFDRMLEAERRGEEGAVGGFGGGAGGGGGERGGGESFWGRRRGS